VLLSSNQKMVLQSVELGFTLSVSRIQRLSAKRKNLTHSVYEVERGNPVWLPTTGTVHREIHLRLCGNRRSAEANVLL
jgi:hypothetical protein